MPGVIFCGSDLIAMGAMNALEQADVRIPEDVSVIGIDDIGFAFLARPPRLTAIRVPRERLGVVAFQALEKTLKLKRRKGAEYYLETELVVRKPTAPAPQCCQAVLAPGVPSAPRRKFYCAPGFGLPFLEEIKAALSENAARDFEALKRMVPGSRASSRGAFEGGLFING